MLKKKYILWLIGIYIFWLCVLPFIVSSAVDVVCKNFSHNSSFELKVTKPRVIFSVIPIVKLKFDEIELVTKNKSFSRSAMQLII